MAARKHGRWRPAAPCGTSASSLPNTTARRAQIRWLGGGGETLSQLDIRVGDFELRESGFLLLASLGIPPALQLPIFPGKVPVGNSLQSKRKRLRQLCITLGVAYAVSQQHVHQPPTSQRDLGCLVP